MVIYNNKSTPDNNILFNEDNDFGIVIYLYPYTEPVPLTAFQCSVRSWIIMGRKATWMYQYVMVLTSALLLACQWEAAQRMNSVQPSSLRP